MTETIWLTRPAIATHFSETFAQVFSMVFLQTSCYVEVCEGLFIFLSLRDRPGWQNEMNMSFVGIEKC